MVHREPPSGSADLKLGAQLIVQENQWAVFFRDGKALDSFEAGRHTLTTLNLPLLGKLIGQDNQWAVFFRDGKAPDTFESGRHTLTTLNLPLVGKLVGLPFGGQSPWQMPNAETQRRKGNEDHRTVVLWVLASLRWAVKG